MFFGNFIFCMMKNFNRMINRKRVSCKKRKFCIFYCNYNKFRFTLKVENWGLCYWDHNEGELLLKITFFLYKVAKLRDRSTLLVQAKFNFFNMHWTYIETVELHWNQQRGTGSKSQSCGNLSHLSRDEVDSDSDLK